MNRKIQSTRRLGVALLDVNAFFALAWPAHEAHRAIRAFMGARLAKRWATCATTELGLLRLARNPAANGGQAVTAATALELLSAFRRHAGHTMLAPQRFLDEPPYRDLLLRTQGYRGTTDAFLIALAHEHKATLVTFDRALTALSPTPETVLVLSR